MKYCIQYTSEARQDLRDIFNYISLELMAPETAKIQAKKIIDMINSLSEFPMRHSLYKREPWKSMGLRFIVVNNYMILYLPNVKNKNVDIVRIMYSGMDISKQLDKNS